MRKAPIGLQDLRRQLYHTAQAAPSWRFGGLSVHLCPRETWRTAYRLAKAKDGAAGVDGVTFEAIEAAGVEAFLPPLREAVGPQTYRPLRLGQGGIPQAGGTRHLLIPAMRDRVVQGALTGLVEPRFAADCQPGS
jgi:RNA-directed DNA polymerase